MLLCLILLYLTRNTTHAAPLSLFSHDSLDVTPPSDPSIRFCPDQRSIWDVLWSCLATIFACSWVSVHPNIPGPDESRIQVALRRLELMFWAVVAPEMIIYWAIRQWLGARRLAQKWEGQGWTRTHGYFIQMGGFILYEGDKQIGVLSPERLEGLFSRGKIKFPTVTEKEIKDRSKADALSKTFVIGQTTWFMLQCIARAIQGLEITQLELLTVALAFLNAFMYFFWWNKPLDVGVPVPVHLSSTGSKNPRHGADASLSSVSLTGQPSGVTAIPLAASEDSDEAAGPLLPTFRNTSCPSVHMWIQHLWTSSRDTAKRVINCLSSVMPRIQKLVKEEGYAGATYAILKAGPWDILASILSPLGDMGGGSKRSENINEGQMRVPTFYALRIMLEDDINVMLSVCTIAMAFGAIHCAGWALAFPSLIEAWIWRISSIAISVTPLLVILTGLFTLLEDGAEVGSLMQKFTKGMVRLFAVPTAVMLPVYILSRILLLVEAFIGLRALTPGARAVVKWTSFLPHI